MTEKRPALWFWEHSWDHCVFLCDLHKVMPAVTWIILPEFKILKLPNHPGAKYHD